MVRNLALPPIYRAVAIEPKQDACTEAALLARDGAADGTFLWADRRDRIDCAVVLEPDRPAGAAAIVDLQAREEAEHDVIAWREGDTTVRISIARETPLRVDLQVEP